ncbi:MAG: DUF6562 domain-containing protein [Muribaculaceae bacterium]|nr:DUF6562 domain-containing protein [Muribaculaceae bacterium]
MKKFIYSAMAVAMLATTSCKDDLAESFVGDEATVEFSISTPEIATRAYSDGTTATHLQYAVYDAAGNILNDLTKTDATINGSTTVNLKLTTGNTYSVIFWAAAPNAPYTVDLANKTMTVDYTGAKSNDENRDAFYKYYTFTVNGAQTETIELKRPFAQLNIGTADYAASTSAGYTPTQSAVKVSNVYSTLNLETGAVDGGSEVTFATADIKKDETFPVAGNEYLAMNYLLVNSKETIEVEFTYIDGTDAKTRTVGSVPVQRNYRTNIYGQLLTSDVDINVEIVPAYNEPAHEAEDLFKAAAFGGEVTLTEDVVLTTPLNVQANMVLNLGGKTLTGAVNVADDVQVTVNNGKIVNTDKTVSGITSNGDLTLNDVEITSARHAIRIESGKAVINGGVYKVAPISKSTLHALNVGDNGTNAEVIIKGGQFIGPKGTMADSGSAVNVRNGSTVAIEGGDFSGGKTKTLANGGTLTVTGGSFDQDPSGYVTDTDLKALKQGDKWYVVPQEAQVVATNDTELRAALKNNQYVVLYADVITTDAESNGYGATGINVNGGVFDGNGYKLVVEGATSTWDSAVAIKGGTIKNLTVAKGFRGIFIKNGTEKVVLENVVVDGPTYTISCDAAGKQGIEAYNSTFNGWTSYAGTIGTAKFVGCSFGKGAGYNFSRPYAPTEYVNCNFAKGHAIDARAKVTFENCTVNGVALTADNLATLVTSNITNASVK